MSTNQNIKLLLVALSLLLLFCNSNIGFSQYQPQTYTSKDIVIEDFENGTINLTSYSTQDKEPDQWELNQTNTYNSSSYSLCLFGNTWKEQNINPIQTDSGDVWQISAFISSTAEIQGVGFADGTNVLFYSFAGTQEVDPLEWETVYQGAFTENEWNLYQMPIADDWISYFDYLPEITSIIYYNDRDYATQGVVYFDYLAIITDGLPKAPVVAIDYSINSGNTIKKDSESFEVQFSSTVTDPDSYTHDFFWRFGDDSTSSGENPLHSFIVTDDHPYTVFLEVTDETGLKGFASKEINIEQGNSSFPLSLNFVGDIMLARAYEEPGGIIPNQGIESIFEPTKAFLGDAADISIANLECPLTTYTESHPTKPIYFKGKPENIDGLTFAGIDVVCLANNHILDFLAPGMVETQTILEENNILHMGSGINSYHAYAPAFYSTKGVNIAFLGASDRTGQYNNYQPYLNAGYNKPGFANLEQHYIKKQIDLVEDVADLVVVNWHTGREYSFIPDKNCDTCYNLLNEQYKDEGYFPLNFAPSESNRETAQFAIDQGADLVICHHPHIMQAVELYNGKLIAYSMGDFVFDLDYPETYPSFILNANANKSGFYEFTCTPVYIDDYIPRRAIGELGLHILEYLAQKSKDLNTYLIIDHDSVVARVITDTSSLPIVKTTFSPVLPTEGFGGDWISYPHPLTKNGSLSSVDSIEPTGSYVFRPGRELLWFGNMEAEGCTLWNLNSTDESYCDSVSFRGIRSIQQIRTASNSSNIVTNLEETIICPSDTTKFSLSTYIKTQNAHNVTIQVRYWESRNSLISLGTEDIGIQISGDTPWTHYHKELNIPVGTNYFDVRLYSGVPFSDTAYSWFDDVSVISWESWNKFQISDEIPTPNDYYFLQAKSSNNPGDITLNYTETGYRQKHPQKFNLKVFLEGPFNGADMDTLLGSQLNSIAQIPLSQPFNTAPWNYNGIESITNPPTSTVDWVLVELRDATDVNSATPSTKVDQKAAFVLNNGQIVDIYGNDLQLFVPLGFSNLYIVVYHRNHLPVLSANPLIGLGGQFTYNFTTSQTQAFNSGQKDLGNSSYGMIAADANADGIIDLNDKISVDVVAGLSGYFAEDFSLDGEVNNSDKNDLWFPNEGKGSQLPQ